MRSQDADTDTAPSTSSRPAVDAGVGVEQVEAALVEHYPRLVRIAYLVLPPTLGRNRRVLTAHALVQRSLPRGRGAFPGSPAVPRARPEGAAAPGYVFVRDRVLRQALDAGLPLRRAARPRRAQFPPLLPHIWGLRVFPRSGGADELALDQRLSALSGPARAAYVLRGLEGLTDAQVRDVLVAAGAVDPGAALADADAVPGGRKAAALLGSPEFDPCSLQVRPTDLIRRRQHTRAALVAVAALAVCGALLGRAGNGWGAGGPAAPPHARDAAAEAALDPGRLTQVAPGAWQQSTRRDFSVWPARGALVDDRDLLGRALAVWARPGGSSRVSATPGTPPGPPMGPPQLLFAGEVGKARVVLLYDGLRVVRYAEPRDGSAGEALDFARTDGAEAVSAAALVAGREDGRVRYLTAPWVREVSVRDLLAPAARPRPLGRDADGLTTALPSPAQASACRAWHTLEIGEGGGARLLTDLGELTPARLTFGPPTAPKDATDPAARAVWARTACSLSGLRSHGVRGVNAWEYARQKLPEANGMAAWLCTRAETWRGAGGRVMVQFHAQAVRPEAPGTVVARAEDSPSCGVREPRVLSGVLWKSQAGQWYVLAAGSGQFASLTVSGGMAGEGAGPVLAVRAREGARAELNGRLTDGTEVGALR
ncbi:hypothetical protein [Streptomyces sp. NPDC018833]|uniref:hypothetical protein n=1 Tax=Streptomyces sp. NPDC018833 TaxID=3365053 RepID=UPI003790EF66